MGILQCCGVMFQQWLTEFALLTATCNFQFNQPNKFVKFCCSLISFGFHFSLFNMKQNHFHLKEGEKNCPTFVWSSTDCKKVSNRLRGLNCHTICRKCNSNLKVQVTRCIANLNFKEQRTVWKFPLDLPLLLLICWLKGYYFLILWYTVIFHFTWET